MRKTSTLAFFFWLGTLAPACADPYADAQKVDTIEAWEQFVAENPESPRVFEAKLRMEELVFNQAHEGKTLEAYDAYLARFPDGKLKEKAMEERREYLMAWADKTDTPEAWQKYMAEYPGGNRKYVVEAKQRLAMAEVKDSLVLGEAQISQVNLAEDPKGPLDGWGFKVPVTNNGQRPISLLVLRLELLNKEGYAAVVKEWPVVAERLPGGLPMPDGFDKPIKPGETRVWDFTTGEVPEGWEQKVNIKPIKVGFPS